MFPSILAASCIILITAPPQPSIDIEKFDKSPLSAKARQEIQMQNHLGPIRSGKNEIQLAAGDTYFGKLSFKLKRQYSRAELHLTLSKRKPSPHFELVEYPLSAKLDEGETNQLVIIYGLRSKEKAPAKKHTLSLRLEIRESKTNRRIRRHNFYDVITILPEAHSSRAIDKNREAYNYFQRRAAKGFLQAKAQQAQVSMRSISGRQAATKQPRATTLDLFLFDRLRADVALKRLRRLAHSKTSSLSTVALYALASLNHQDPKPRKRLRHQLSSPQIALHHASIAFKSFAFDDAEILARHARNSGKLKRKDLARSIAILGALDLVRKRDTHRKHFGQAHCLDAQVTAPTQIPIVTTAFQEVAKTKPCPDGIKIGQLTATRRIKDDVNMVYVTGEFGPDPHELVSGGNIELWGAGGEIIEIAKVRASHGTKNFLTTTFEDRGDIQNYLGQILVRLVAKDLSGVPIATFGKDGAIPLEIDDSEISVMRHIDWWMWLLAGLAVAAGGAVAATQLIDDEPKRGIGPVNIRF